MKRIRDWTVKAGFSVLDQALTSAATFVLNIVLARVLPPEEYGAFALGFTIFLVLASIHSALLIEPMSVLGPARHKDDLAQYVRRTLWVHFALMTVLALLTFAAAVFYRHEVLGPALLGMSVSSPLILFFWTVRRAHYLETRPDLATISSAIQFTILSVTVFSLWRLQILSAGSGFLALAAAGVVAGVFSLVRLKVQVPRSLRDAVESIAVGRENWDFGRWLLPSALFYPLLSQVQIILAAKFLGLGAAGILRALQNPILPVMQVISALSTLAIPMLARDFGEGHQGSMYRRGLVYTGAMTLIALLYEIAVIASGDLWDRLLYGNRYSDYAWLMPVLGIVPIANAIATGCSIILRAIQRPELTTATHIAGGILGLIVSTVLILRVKLPGAVYGLVLSHVMTAIISVLVTWRAHVGTKGSRPAPDVTPVL